MIGLEMRKRTRESTRQTLHVHLDFERKRGEAREENTIFLLCRGRSEGGKERLNISHLWRLSTN